MTSNQTDGARNWEAVDGAIRRRMRDLGMSTARLARETGLSETTIRYIGQSNTRHNKSSLVAISAVLRRRYDYLTNILRGEPHKNVRIKSTLLETLNAEVVSLKNTVRDVDNKIDTLLKYIGHEQIRDGVG